MLIKLEKIGSSLTSFCKTKNKTLMHIFCECSITIRLRNQLRCSLEKELNFPPLTPHSASILGLTNLADNLTLLNHLLLNFEFYVYSAAEKNLVNIFKLKSAISSIKNVCWAMKVKINLEKIKSSWKKNPDRKKNNNK